jgi:predicted nucleotidyltransferase
MEVNQYIDEIKTVLAPVEGLDYAYLFGSALNRLLPNSDIDILAGGDLDFDRKTRLSMDLSLLLKKNVDIVLAKEAPCELILKALSRGRPILVHKRKSLREDYFRNYFLYDANTSLRNIRLERIKRIYGR